MRSAVVGSLEYYHRRESAVPPELIVPDPMQTVLTGLAALAILTLFGLPVTCTAEGLASRPSPSRAASAGRRLHRHRVGGAQLGIADAGGRVDCPLRRCRRRRRRLCRPRPVWRRYRYVVRFVPLVLLVALIGGTIAWLPSLLVDSALVVQPSSNSDAIWYVASSRWIIDHPLFTVPDVGLSPPPAWTGCCSGLPSRRCGSRQARAGIRAGHDQRADRHPACCRVLGVARYLGDAWSLRCVGHRRGVPDAHHSRARVRTAVRRVRRHRSPRCLRRTHHPFLRRRCFRWRSGSSRHACVHLPRGGCRSGCAATVVSAVIATYSEYLPFLGLTLAALVLTSPRTELLPRLGRGAMVAAVAVLVAPVPWFRALGATFVASSIASNGNGRAEDGVLQVLGTFGRMMDETQGHLAPRRHRPHGRHCRRHCHRSGRRIDIHPLTRARARCGRRLDRVRGCAGSTRHHLRRDSRGRHDRAAGDHRCRRRVAPTRAPVDPQYRSPAARSPCSSSSPSSGLSA